MKKITEDINTKCKKLSQDSSDYLYKVAGGADCLSWDMHLLADFLSKDYTIGYDGHTRLHALAGKIDAISSEIQDLVNMFDDKGMMP